MSVEPLRMAEAFIHAGELDDALASLAEHLDAQPTDEFARRLRAAVRLRVATDEALRAALTDLDKITNTTQDDYVQRSIILERLGDLKGASQALMQANTISPGDHRLTERYLQVLVLDGEIERALALVDRMPKSWRWIKWRADLVAQYEGPENAVSCYNETLNQLNSSLDTETDPVARAIKAEVLTKRGHMYSKLQRYEDAEADFAAAQEIIPTDPMLSFFRGLLAAERGDVTLAVELCGAALQQANETLEAQMINVLQSDTRYGSLAALLLQGDADG